MAANWAGLGGGGARNDKVIPVEPPVTPRTIQRGMAFSMDSGLRRNDIVGGGGTKHRFSSGLARGTLVPAESGPRVEPEGDAVGGSLVGQSPCPSGAG